MSHFVKNRLLHIRDEITILLEVIEHTSKEKFDTDELLKRAVSRCLEIIGEASKKIPLEFREQNSTIPWAKMAGMRDILIHNYDGIDYLIVWDTIIENIPELKPLIDSLIEELEEDE